MRGWILAALAAAGCAQPPENTIAVEGDGGVRNDAGTGQPELPPSMPQTANAAAPEPAPAQAPAPAPAEPYTARGQEPGWALTIDKGRIDYRGNYGEKRILVASPEPLPLPDGRRYVTERLTVEIVHERCNDAMSGFGFEDRVRITADGEVYEGCGGPRRTDWDM